MTLSSYSRVTGQPSSKTSFVIVGDDAGPKKLETIKKLGVKTLDEDGFLNLIGTRKGPGNGKGLDEKAKKKKEKDEKEIRKAAEEIEKREKEEKKERERKDKGKARDGLSTG